MTARKKPDTKPQIEEQPDPQGSPDEPLVIEPAGPVAVPPVRTDAPTAEPAPVAGDGQVVLVVRDGADVFATNRDDVSALTRTGTAVPEQLADELIAFAADNGVTVTKLED